MGRIKAQLAPVIAQEAMDNEPLRNVAQLQLRNLSGRIRKRLKSSSPSDY